MTEQRESRIPYDDLLHMVIECKCGTEITIDFTKQESREIEWQDRGFVCPMCRKGFDSNLKLALNDFMRWQDEIKLSGETVFFRIKSSN